MSIKDRLMTDLKEAMKNKEVLRKETIQICRAAILQVEKDSLSELDESGVIQVLAKEFRKRSDTLSELGDRQDIIDKYKAEMEIIRVYLPEQLSEEETERLVVDAIAETGAASLRDLGKVMQFLQPKIKGRADGRTVSDLIRKHLGA